MRGILLLVCIVIIAGICVEDVESHSWLDLPASRYPVASKSSEYCMKYDDGTTLTPNVCGKDAQGVDIKLMRPSTYQQRPCFYPAGHTYNDAPTAVIEANSVLCAMWGSNAHATDPTRDLGGGVFISITNNVVDPTQADFDKMVLARIPYDQFGGVKIQLPPLPIGEYLLQFYWDWPITDSVEHIFVSCSDLTILAPNDPRLTTQQSPTYKMGLPVDFRPDVNSWNCNADDKVYTNTTIIVGSTTSASSKSTTSSSKSTTTSSSKSTTTSSSKSTTTSFSSTTSQQPQLTTSDNSGLPGSSDASFLNVVAHFHLSLIVVCLVVVFLY